MRRSRPAFVVALLLLAACEGGGPARPTGTGAAGLRQDGAKDARLAPPGEWSRLNPGGPFLVSPAWLPGGQRAIAAGRKGIGLFSVDAKGTSVESVAPGMRGALHRAGGGLCLLSGARHVTVEAAAGQQGGVRLLETDASGCGLSPTPSGTTGLVLFSGERGEIVHDLHTGDVLLRRGGREEKVQEGDAWGVAVAPGGGRVAWCLGHLTDPVLMVHDMASGKTFVVGRGAHPAWLPDGSRIVYDVPAAGPVEGGARGIAAADLFLYAWGDAEGRRLADTPDIVEMQPAVSPDGGTLLFSDWRTGALWAAPLLAGQGGGR